MRTLLVVSIVAGLSTPLFADPTPCTAPTTVDRGASRRQTAKVIGLVGAGLWIAANQLAWYERSNYERAIGHTGAPDATAANRAVDVTRYYGTGLFLAGTAALGTAAYLYFSAPKEERVTRYVPVVGPDQVGFVVHRSF